MLPLILNFCLLLLSRGRAASMHFSNFLGHVKNFIMPHHFTRRFSTVCKLFFKKVILAKFVIRSSFFSFGCGRCVFLVCALKLNDSCILRKNNFVVETHQDKIQVTQKMRKISKIRKKSFIWNFLQSDSIFHKLSLIVHHLCGFMIQLSNDFVYFPALQGLLNEQLQQS